MKQSIAESFVNADAVIIVDTSGSMNAPDSRGGLTRYTVACEELATLQRNMPGKLAVIAFSDTAMFCPGGQPHFFHGGTNLAGALAFARIADVPGMRFYVISDGHPDEEAPALAEAARYKAPISTIYVGPEGESQGRAFLAKLAAAAGGQAVKAERVMALGAKLQAMLQERN
jgi:Mg-chelatase subunit ChlD